MFWRQQERASMSFAASSAIVGDGPKRPFATVPDAKVRMQSSAAGHAQARESQVSADSAVRRAGVHQPQTSG